MREETTDGRVHRIVGIAKVEQIAVAEAMVCPAISCLVVLRVFRRTDVIARDDRIVGRQWKQVEVLDTDLVEVCWRDDLVDRWIIREISDVVALEERWHSGRGRI